MRIACVFGLMVMVGSGCFEDVSGQEPDVCASNSENLLVNGGMETLSGWLTNNATLSLEESDYCSKAVLVSIGDGFGNISQAVAAQGRFVEGDTLHVRAFAQTTNSRVTMQLAFNYEGGEFESSFILGESLGDGWLRYEGEVVVPESTSAVRSFAVSMVLEQGPDAFVLDQVLVEVVE